MREIDKKTVLLLLGLIIAATWSFSVIYAEIDAPSLSVGDTWTYEMTYTDSGLVEVRTETVDKIEDYEGVACYVWIRYDPATIDDTPVNATSILWMTLEGGLLKVDYDTPGLQQRTVQTFSPEWKWKYYDFPLTIGKEWSGLSSETLTEMDSEGQIIYSQPNARSVNWHAKVVSTESVTVPAGTFDTYVIEETLPDMNRTLWFSVDVKNHVRMEAYREGDLLGQEVLTSYDVAVQGDGEGDGQANGQGDDFSFMLLPVGLAVLIVVLVLTVFLYYRRRQAMRDTGSKPPTNT